MYKFLKKVLGAKKFKQAKWMNHALAVFSDAMSYTDNYIEVCFNRGDFTNDADLSEGEFLDLIHMYVIEEHNYLTIKEIKKKPKPKAKPKKIDPQKKVVKIVSNEKTFCFLDV